MLGGTFKKRLAQFLKYSFDEKNIFMVQKNTLLLEKIQLISFEKTLITP